MTDTDKKAIEEMARQNCDIKYHMKNYKTCKECYETNYCACRVYEVCRNLYNAGYRKQSGWISVERLPESGEHCLVSCTVKRCDGTLGQYICIGYYAEKFKHLAYGVDDDCVSEYNEENDEYYIAEGWYEVIKNWDDYGFVAIDDFVTHWMPLPEPPKGD